MGIPTCLTSKGVQTRTRTFTCGLTYCKPGDGGWVKNVKKTLSCSMVFFQEWQKNLKGGFCKNLITRTRLFAVFLNTNQNLWPLLKIFHWCCESAVFDRTRRPIPNSCLDAASCTELMTGRGVQNFNLEYKTYFVLSFPFPSVQFSRA